MAGFRQTALGDDEEKKDKYDYHEPYSEYDEPLSYPRTNWRDNWRDKFEPTTKWKENNYYDQLEPGDLKITIAIPIKDCGIVGNPDHPSYDYDLMLAEAEKLAEDIMKTFNPKAKKLYKFNITSEESIDTIEVSIKLSPLN